MIPGPDNFSPLIVGLTLASSGVFVWWTYKQYAHSYMAKKVLKQYPDVDPYSLDEPYFDQNVRMHVQLSALGAVAFVMYMLHLPAVAWHALGVFAAPGIIAIVQLDSINSSAIKIAVQKSGWCTVSRSIVETAYGALIVYMAVASLVTAMISSFVTSYTLYLAAMGGGVYAMYITWLHSPRLIAQGGPHPSTFTSAKHFQSASE